METAFEVSKMRYVGNLLECYMEGNDVDFIDHIVLYDESSQTTLDNVTGCIDQNMKEYVFTINGEDIQINNKRWQVVAQLKDGSKVKISCGDYIYDDLRCVYFSPVTNCNYWVERDDKGLMYFVAARTGNAMVQKNGFFLSEVKVHGDKMEFVATASSKRDVRDAKVILWCKRFKTTKEIGISKEELTSGHLVIDLANVKEELVKGNVRWDVLLMTRDTKGKYVFLRMEHEKNIGRKRSKNAFNFAKPHKEELELDQLERFPASMAVTTRSEDDMEMVLSPNYTIDYQLSLQGVSKNRLYMRAFTEKITDVYMDNNRLTIKIRCKNRGFEMKGLVLSLQNNDKERYALKMQDEIKGAATTEYTFSVAFEAIPWTAGIWKLAILEEKDGQEYDIRPVNTSKKFERHMYKYNWNRSKRMGDNILFIVYMVNGNVQLRFREYTKYDDIKYRKQEKKARLLYLLGKPILDRLGIILLFERFSTAAQDNGVFMFEYYREQTKKKAYYVIDPDYPDYKRVEQYGKYVIPFMSLRHMIYMQCAKVYVSTDTKKHGYQWLGPNSRVYNKILTKPNVFLQHGVLALKEVSAIYDRYKSNAMDLFITSSEIEKAIVNKYFRYENPRIAVTGLARWDVLFDKSKEYGKKEILFIPTWRGWMDGITKEEFLESDYYRRYKALLESQALVDMLEEHDTTIVFCMHHKFREFADEFPSISDRIVIFDFGDVAVNELIMRCSMLITDYSSVAWDAYYIEKPIIFYQFDYEKYMELQGSYFDLTKDMFGTRVLDEGELLRETKKCIEGGFMEKEEYIKLREQYLPYRDHNHCKRIEEAIDVKHFKGKTEVIK